MEAPSPQPHPSWIIRSIADAAVIINPEGIILHWNQEAEVLFGYQPDEIVGRHITHLSPSDLFSEFSYITDLLRSEQQISGIETIRIRKDQQEIMVCLSCSHLWTGAGYGSDILIVYQDISGFKEIEKNLGRELMLNSSLTDLASILINPDVSFQEICTQVLQYAIILTGSVYGVIAASQRTNGNSLLEVMDVGEEGWPFLDITKLPVISQAELAAGYSESSDSYVIDTDQHPDGLSPFRARIMIVPVWIDDHLVGRIGLAEPLRPYSDFERTAASRICTIFGLAIRRIHDRTTIMTALEEKEVLLAEVHHRVKNNMQVISSLLSMQSKQITDTAVREIFLETHNRIHSIAKVHELLYISGNYSCIYYDDFLKKLLSYLSDFYRSVNRNITVEVLVEQVRIPLSQAIPLSLIATELITNAYKYAFPGCRSGTINIDLKSGPITGSGILIIRDDGVGLPQGLDPLDMPSMGMRLITGLIEQISGTCTFNSLDSGLEVLITFPPDTSPGIGEEAVFD